MALSTKCYMSGVSFSLTGKSFQSTTFDKVYPRHWVHPIFSISYRASIDLMRQVFATPENFDETETYLIGLSLISSTGLVEFAGAPKITTIVRDNITITPSSIINRKAAELIKLASFVSALGDSVRLKLPHFRITPETHIVEFVECFIDTLDAWKIDRDTSGILAKQLAAQEFAEASLRKAIERYGQSSTYVAAQLATWACKAANFPEFEIKNPLSSTGTKIKLCDYWKEIILRCVNESKIFVVPPTDLTELLEHCLQFLSAKDYLFHKLIQHLERGFLLAKNYLDDGDTSYNVANKSFAIIPEETSLETASTIAMIKSAPSVKPVESDYPTKLDFLKAQAKWTKLQQFLESGKTIDELTGISVAVAAKKLSEITPDEL